MDISINTPALLFPAISLVMLAYSNRFLALTNRVRTLRDEYSKGERMNIIHGQIKNIRYRIKLIKYMQAFGVMTFLGSLICMYFIYIDSMVWAHFIFAISILFLACSLSLSLLEIIHSTRAIELELSDIEGLEDPSVVQYIKKKFDKD